MELFVNELHINCECNLDNRQTEYINFYLKFSNFSSKNFYQLKVLLKIQHFFKRNSNTWLKCIFAPLITLHIDVYDDS